jgi:hypothetical protein
MTKRGILSIVSSVYDPLGIVSPFVLTGRSILQNLCKQGIAQMNNAFFHCHPLMENRMPFLNLCRLHLRSNAADMILPFQTLVFQINIKSKPMTKRGIVSIVSSVYDPLGIVSPFVLTGRSILQNICKQGIEWDEEIGAFIV